MVSRDSRRAADIMAAAQAEGRRGATVTPENWAKKPIAGTPGLIVVLGATDDGDTCATVRLVRRDYHGPLLVLAAAGADEIDELMAFACGADDFVREPQSPRLLRARIAALLRRGTTENQSPVIRVGPIAVDRAMRTVTVADHPVHLTRTEFDLLRILMENPRRVVPRSELMHEVWGDWQQDEHTLEVHISRMRAKLRAADGPRVAEPMPGLGYRLGPWASAARPADRPADLGADVAAAPAH